MHIVWDWNGTLFDDLHVVVDSVNRALELHGAGPISADDYRELYTRPVSRFYERLLGRPISDREWHDLDVAFHDAYAERIGEAGLAPDAKKALELVERSERSQSLLSMFPHDELVPIVSQFDIGRYMTRIDGLRALSGDNKHGYLEAHLEALAVVAHRAIVIGDSLDDVAAARHVGAWAVLYNSGSHHRDRLEATGAPVADTLVDAVQLALLGGG